MNNIIDEIKKEIINRSNEFEEKTKGTKEEYNLYEKHVKYVYKYATLLAKDEEVDLEVVQLSALLHDIAMTDPSLDRARHSEYGPNIAGDILKKYNYPEDKIELIKKCILNHSSKRKNYRTTKEEEILVDADALSHFDGIESIYSLAHNVMELSEEESINFVKDKLTKDYNEVSDRAKMLIEDKYNKIMKANTIQELLGKKG